MTKEELRHWFWLRFNSCYPMAHKDYPNNIIMLYDKNTARDIKLNSIIYDRVYKPSKMRGEWLFYLNFDNGQLDVDYLDVWKFFEDNYEDNYSEITELIKSFLQEINLDDLNIMYKMREGSLGKILEISKLEPSCVYKPYHVYLDEMSKLEFI